MMAGTTLTKSKISNNFTGFTFIPRAIVVEANVHNKRRAANASGGATVGCGTYLIYLLEGCSILAPMLLSLIAETKEETATKPANKYQETLTRLNNVLAE